MDESVRYSWENPGNLSQISQLDIQQSYSTSPFSPSMCCLGLTQIIADIKGNFDCYKTKCHPSPVASCINPYGHRAYDI